LSEKIHLFSSLSGKDIIVFSDDWGRHPFSCQHIIERLLPYNRVLWVNTIGYRTIKINFYDINRIIEKIKNWVKKEDGDEKINNLTVINPICLPFGKYALVRLFNRFSIVGVIKKYADKLKFKNSILITTLPTTENVIGRLNESFSCYYCVDDFTLWPGSERDLICRLEKKLLDKVDLVIASSDKLKRTRNNHKRETKLLTHGVDIEHFTLNDKKLNPRVGHLRKPIVAYYGLIDERCNLKLLIEVVQRMSHITFLLIGEWRIDNRAFLKLKNVFITGNIPYKDLPSYIVSSSVLILPYHLNELSESINPLKLKEYIATGLPVIATPLIEVIKLKEFITIADTVKSFCDQIEGSLNQNRISNNEKFMSFIMNQSWEIKAKQFADFFHVN